MKNKIELYLCIAAFGIVGVYLTFFAGNVDKYDSQTKAYRIYINERYDSDQSIVSTWGKKLIYEKSANNGYVNYYDSVWCAEITNQNDN